MTEEEKASRKLQQLGIQFQSVFHFSEKQPFAKKTQSGGRAFLWSEGWTPEDLEAIAEYLRSKKND